MSSGGSDHLPGGLPPDDSDDDRIVGHRLLDKVLLVVELRRDLEVHTERFFILVMRKAETVRRLEHHDARRANISRFEIAPVLALRAIGEAAALGLALDPPLALPVRNPHDHE